MNKVLERSTHKENLEHSKKEVSVAGKIRWLNVGQTPSENKKGLALTELTP